MFTSSGHFNSIKTQWITTLVVLSSLIVKCDFQTPLYLSLNTYQLEKNEGASPSIQVWTGPKRDDKKVEWIEDKFHFLKSHIRCKGCSKSSGFNPRRKEPVHTLLQPMTSPELQLTQTVWRSVCGQQTPHYSINITPHYSHKLHHSFRAFFSRPTGHGPVHTDENHAVIICQAKAGESTYSLLQLPCIGSKGIRREGLSDIQKQGCKSS